MKAGVSYHRQGRSATTMRGAVWVGKAAGGVMLHCGGACSRRATMLSHADGAEAAAGAIRVAFLTLGRTKEAMESGV